MSTDNLDIEILELTIKHNKAEVELYEEANSSADMSKIEKVFALKKQLEEKINLKNSLL